MKRLSVFNVRLLIFCVVLVLVTIFCQVPPENQYDYNEATSVNVFTMTGFGTGNFINTEKRPYILTCKHVAGIPESTGPISVGAKGNVLPGKLVVTSKTKDFSIIEVEQIPLGNKIAKYENRVFNHMGDKIYYFGLIARPGLTFLHEGTISQKNLEVKGVTCLYDAGYFNLSQGSSGSTVFNKDGRGIGIVCLGNRSPYASHCLYLKIDDIRKSLGSLQILDGILDGKCDVKISDMHNGPIEVP